MKYQTATAFRTALEARLRNRAAEGSVSLVRLRKLVVFERLLARFMVVAPERWVLKGGVALDFRFGERARTTMDLDLARRGADAHAKIDMRSVESIDLQDYFTFTVQRVSAITDAQQDVAVRYRAAARLDRRRFEEITVDVGIDPVPCDRFDALRAPALLEFAGIRAIEVPALPLELHVAEKLHAYSRTFEDRRPNTRVKDLIDLVLIPSFSALGAEQLHGAIR